MARSYFVGRSTEITVDESGAAMTLSDGWGGDLVLVFTSPQALDRFAAEARTALRALEDNVAEAYAKEARRLLELAAEPRVEDETVRDDYEWPEVVR